MSRNSRKRFSCCRKNRPYPPRRNPRLRNEVLEERRMLAATDPTLDPISDFAVDQDVREWHEPALGEAIVLYDPQTGEISVNTSQPLTTFEMRSGNRIFTGSPALNRDSPFDVDRDDKIFKLSTEGFGDLSFGEVAQVNYGQTALEQDLDFDGTFVDGAHPNFVLISAGNNDEAVIVNLSGITAGDDGPQPLSITAISDNTSLISDPFITYLSNDQTGRLAFSPLAGQHGVATITVMVEDGGPDLELNTSADNARFSRSFDVTINPPLVVNAPPTLDAIDTLNIDEGTVDQIVDLSGITAGGDDAQPLRVTATSNDLNLVNHPTISYRSGDSTGSLSITTVPDKNGTATIQVVVEDGGLDGDLSTTDDNAAVSRSFNVTVIPGNDPPTLTVAGLTMETPVSEDSCSISLDPTAFDVDAVGLLEDPGFAIAAPRMDESPIADGLIADGEYANQCFFTYAENENPGHSWPGLDNLNDGDADLTSRVHFAHTNESLFIAFDVTDDFLDLDPGSSVKNDGVELFINADLDSGDAWGPGKMQLYVDAFEGGTDLGLNNRGSSAGISAVSTIGPEAGEFYSAGLVREDGSGYVIEFEIPLASLDTAGGDGDRVPVTTGDFVLINAAVDDNDAGDNLNAQSGHHLLWHTAGASSPWGGGEKVWNVPLAFTESGKLVIDEDTPERTVELVGITAGGDESQPLRVTATSSDISLIDHPNVNYTSDDSTGSLILNPVGNQGGMATITVTVEDGGLDGDLDTINDNDSSSIELEVTVKVRNKQPTLDAIDNLAIAEDAIEQMINFSGVTAGAGESQSIKVTAASDNEGLISDPFVSYTSGNSTGRLIFSPVADQSGTAIITVSVEDSGLDGDLDTSADNAVFSRSFEVFVNPINDAPTLDVLADLGLNVGSGPQVMDLAGITAGPGESQPLRVTALSNAVNLVAHPTVGYTSDNTTGTFLITPIGAESGTATITVTVEDGGLDGDLSTSADNARFSRTMQVAIYPTGDLTRDGKLDADDIDAICPLINANANVADLNNDDSIDNKDFVYLVRDLIGSDFGDANLDGQFDSSDLVQIFVAGEYDDGVSGNSGWAEGDWTCDGEFDSSDLVAAFLSGSYVSPATPAAVDGALSLPTPESLLSEPSLQQADELADDGTIRLADPWAPTALEELAVVDQLFDQSEDDPAPWLADSADELELDWTV